MVHTFRGSRIGRYRIPFSVNTQSAAVKREVVSEEKDSVEVIRLKVMIDGQYMNVVSTKVYHFYECMDDFCFYVSCLGIEREVDADIHEYVVPQLEELKELFKHISINETELAAMSADFYIWIYLHREAKENTSNRIIFG